MKNAIITIKDEVYAYVTGLKPQDQEFLEDKFAYMVEGARWMPLYKLGVWDGKVKFFDKNGKIFLRLLDEVVEYLDGWNYDIVLNDERPETKKVDTRITKDWFIDKEGSKNIELRPYQVDAINLMLDVSEGVVLAATASGKTFLCAGLCDIFGQNEKRCIIIVPSVDLVDQTAASFRLVGIDVGVYGGKNKDIHHKHLISTWQSLQNNPTLIESYEVLIVDECVHPDTLIDTIDGPIPIKDIKVGQLVKTLNEITDEFEFNKVLKIYHNLSVKEKKFEILCDNGEKLIITGNHKILTSNGWKRVDELTLNDELI